MFTLKKQGLIIRYNSDIYFFNFRIQDSNGADLYSMKTFLEQKKPITIDSFRYFLENKPADLYNNYQNITPNLTRIVYSSAMPFHSNGLSKKEINYQDFFSLSNVVIKHFSSFLNHGDKNENNKSPVIINSEQEKPLNFNFQTNFTLIYLITVSKPSNHLIREINAMSGKETAFILFYDNKSDRSSFYDLLSKEVNNGQFANVFIIDSPRFHVGWSEITQAFTQLVMMQASIKYFSNSLYISCHSDSDYPLYPTKYIVKYLKENYPKNYIYTFPIYREGWKKSRKHDFRLFFNDNLNSSQKVKKVICTLFPNKTIPNANWKSGWNWFTLTLKDADVMIKKMLSRFDIVESLDYTKYADEIIFSTLAAEAGIKSTNKFTRYVNWRGCTTHPNYLEKKHFSQMTRSNCNFWARKFRDDEKSRIVLDMIDNRIHELSIDDNFKIIC